jgi:hypothetical protein
MTAVRLCCLTCAQAPKKLLKAKIPNLHDYKDIGDWVDKCVFCCLPLPFFRVNAMCDASVLCCGWPAVRAV